MGALEQQAHAHSQQLCPELDPQSLAVRCYEVEQLRRASLAFQANADIRSQAVAPAAPILIKTECDNKVRIRSGDADDAALAVAAFQVAVHCGHRSLIFDVPVLAGAAASSDGMEVILPGAFEPGVEHAVIAAASFGRGGFGVQSQPLLCHIAGSSTHASPNRSRRSLKVQKSMSLGRVPNIEIVEASGTAVGTLSLAWEAPPQLPAGLTWTVVLEPYGSSPEGQSVSMQGLDECRASFTDLTPSTTYLFCISPVVSGLESQAAAIEEVIAPKADALAVTGTRFSPSASSVVLPAPTEGVVALPPFNHDALAALKRDPRLRPFTRPGVFVRLLGRS